MNSISSPPSRSSGTPIYLTKACKKSATGLIRTAMVGWLFQVKFVGFSPFLTWSSIFFVVIGNADEGLLLLVFYEDKDSDTFGNASSTFQACAAPDGYVSDFRDCDDSDASVYPGYAKSSLSTLRSFLILPFSLSMSQCGGTMQ